MIRPEMQMELPDWAMGTATPADLARAREALGQGRLELKWPDAKSLRKWARHHGWPTPWFGFERTFVTQMLQNEANFALALGDSGLEVRLPNREHFIGAKALEELDSLYDARSSSDPRQPTEWGTLVALLREIRRAVEAGVVVTIEGGPVLRSWQGFYEWAHGRYHMLEDGYDSWIGHDID